MSDINQIFRFRIILSGIIILLAVGCSTQKNTFVNRNFHSITTKYNGYFNARENYREGLASLAEKHEDNYETVLSIFQYGSEQQASSVAGQMDIAFQKTSTAIRKHSMNIKGVEYNRWIDDSYFLIGRSHYFKRDYNLAILTFEYVIRQFETPLKNQSIIWVAKCYTGMENYEQAVQTLERLDEAKKAGEVEKETLALYHMVFADIYLRQELYSEAVPHLQQAIDHTRNPKLKTRLTFILAQSYHQIKNYGNAQKTYLRVLKLSPDFQMAFQARINMAMAFDTESGDRGFILSELENMLKDGKNDDFKDQIYYALAQFSMRQKDEEKAIEYYNLALENFKDNRSQKGITFLRLGEIYHKNKDYPKAAELYDSTMVYLSTEYPDYKDAAQTSFLLKELSVYQKTINKEDSLQKIAAMNEAQRNRVLDQIIEDLKEEERLEKEKEQERARMRQEIARQGRSRNQQGQDASWYFYNPSSVSFGKNEFYAKWGERKLEDLWRISNKQVIAFGDMEGFEMEEDSIQGSNVTRSVLMQNLPLTQEELDESNEKIALAYYNMALLFKDRMNDMPSAVENFRVLIERFPENENVLYSAYFLYSMFNQENKRSQANVYKEYILKNFPDTDFARILSDPDYAENIRDRQNQAKYLYQQAYEAYMKQDYGKSLELTKQSDTMELSREQEAQFSFLKALNISKTARKSQLKDQLTIITENYQDTRVYEPANNLLAYLDEGEGEGEGLMGGFQEEMQIGEVEETDSDDQNILANSVFSQNPDAVHFFVIMVDSENISVRQLRNDVDVFNKETFEEKTLNMSTLFFEQGRQLITVTNFPDAKQAMDYGDKLKEDLSQKQYDSDLFTSFAISVENYPVFYQERKLDDYLDFYQIAYRF
ncbi:MAG: tetratricopeptide repeat protein [Bacteroidota bacterium]